MYMMPIKQIFIVLILSILCACNSSIHAPVDQVQTARAYRPAPVNFYAPEPVTRGFHQVVDGDTLYSIAWRYGLDYRDVAIWNGIEGQYLIHPGDRLRLVPPAESLRSPETRPSAVESETDSNRIPPTPADNPSSPSVPATTATAAAKSQLQTSPVIIQRNILWQWPTPGEIIKSNTPIAQKGLDISGREGQDIHAAADGIVVYSGSGLLGYGKLIIIKHNDKLLSAYAHNQFMQVKEGDRVNAGQKISTMGKDNKGQVLLHFEIRVDGNPVDPLQYLPART